MSFPLCDSIPRAYVVLIICFCYKIRQKLAHLKKKQYLCPRKGLNTMTTQTKMFNFTPPSRRNVAYFLTLVILLCLWAFMRGYHAGKSYSADTCGADVPKPVEIRRSLFHNPDSIAFYSAIAANEDNPRALFIAGMAAHLRLADPDYPQDIVTVPLDTADFYLIRAAELGSEDAMTYIRCCEYHGTWNHFVPQVK